MNKTNSINMNVPLKYRAYISSYEINKWRENPLQEITIYSYLYFVECKELDLVKVGYTSQNPIDRVKQIQTGFPYDVNLVHSFRLESNMWCARNYESYVHKKINSCLVGREWFKSSDIKVSEILTELKSFNELTYENHHNNNYLNV